MSGLRDILTQDSFFLVFLLEAEMFQSRYSGAPVGRMLWIGNRHLLNGRMEESFQLQSFDIDRRTPWHPNDNPAECIHKQRARQGRRGWDVGQLADSLPLEGDGAGRVRQQLGGQSRDVFRRRDLEIVQIR